MTSRGSGWSLICMDEWVKTWKPVSAREQEPTSNWAERNRAANNRAEGRRQKADKQLVMRKRKKTPVSRGEKEKHHFSPTGLTLSLFLFLHLLNPSSLSSHSFLSFLFSILSFSSKWDISGYLQSISIITPLHQLSCRISLDLPLLP